MSNPTLVDVSGGAETLTIGGASIQSNTIVVDGGTLERRRRHRAWGALRSRARRQPGRHARRGRRESTGYSSNPKVGFYVLPRHGRPGPFSTVELTYDLSAATFDNPEHVLSGERNRRRSDQLPLVVVQATATATTTSGTTTSGRNLASYRLRAHEPREQHGARGVAARGWDDPAELRRVPQQPRHDRRRASSTATSTRTTSSGSATAAGWRGRRQSPTTGIFDGVVHAGELHSSRTIKLVSSIASGRLPVWCLATDPHGV
jgi:hypothetical protein